MKKILVSLVFVVALVALAGYRINARITRDKQARERASEVTLPSVTVGKVERRQMQARVLITGNIRPENEVDIFSKASGRAVKVNVELGDRVRAGQVLAMLEQDMVLLQLKQAHGALEGARANLTNAQKNAESAEALAKSNNIPDVQLVGARSALQAARAGVIQAEAAVGLAREGLQNTRITSPINGVITKKNLNIGVMVTPGAMGPQSALFQVQSLATLKLEASIEEREIGLVSLGQQVRFRVDSLPDHEFTGTVRRLSPSLDPVSRRALIEIAIQNPEGKLYANMFARGEILEEETRDVVAVPKVALVKGATGSAVYVAQGNTVKLRPVVLGQTDGEYIAVREGLVAGDQVVLTGHSALSDGREVQVTAAVPTQAGTTAPTGAAVGTPAEEAAAPAGEAAAPAKAGDAPQAAPAGPQEAAPQTAAQAGERQ